MAVQTFFSTLSPDLRVSLDADHGVESSPFHSARSSEYFNRDVGNRLAIVIRDSGALNATGPRAFKEFIAMARAQMGLTVHTPHYGLYTFVSGDLVQALVGAHLELAMKGALRYGVVRYVDEYRRTPDGWRISKRDMRTVFIASWSEVGEAVASDTPVRWPGLVLLASDFPRRVSR